MATTVLLNGEQVDFDACVNLMDDDLRELVHRDIAPCSDQQFLDEYCKRHFDKYGEDFTL
jgi:hypothetical protein